jgi:hypothetical protein
MDYLNQRKTELENEISKFEFPLFYSQVQRRDKLIKELKEIRLQEVILNAKKIKAIHNRA